MPMLRRLASLAATLALLTAPLGAQVVTGRVLREDGRTGLAGAVVALVHDNERIRPQLADADGRFTFRNAPTGAWIVQAEAPGYGTSYSQAFRMGARDSVEVTVRMSLMADQLRAFRLSSLGAKCINDPGAAERTALVWNAVRAALEASIITEREQKTPLEITVVDNDLDVGRDKRAAVPVKTTRAWSGLGFRAYPPEVLEQSGYVKVFGDTIARATEGQSMVVRPDAGGGSVARSEKFVETTVEEREYYLPDAELLMSRSFLVTHCFSVSERRGRDGARAVGLTFAPGPDRAVPEVSGTLWLDVATGALRTLEVTFVEPGRPKSLPRAEAKLEFTQLPTGRWVVQHWTLTMPVERSVRNRMDNGYDLQLAGWREREGTARVLPLAEAATIAPGAVVTGRIVDNTTGKPLSDAVFTLKGVGTEVVDANGAFTFRVTNPLAVPQPTELTMQSERATALGVAVPLRAIKFNPGDTVRVNLALPTAQVMRDALCGATRDSLTKANSAAAAWPAVIIGRATNATTGDGEDDAMVVASWPIDSRGQPSRTPTATMARRVTWTAPGGRFAACAVPDGVPVTVHAEKGGAKGPAVTVTPDATGLTDAYVSLPAAAAPSPPPRKP